MFLLEKDVIVDQVGPHRRMTVNGAEAQAGEGGSKREAEQDAALKLLTRLGLKS